MKYNYDELTIKEKFKEIKGVALENIKNGKLYNISYCVFNGFNNYYMNKEEKY